MFYLVVHYLLTKFLNYCSFTLSLLSSFISSRLFKWFLHLQRNLKSYQFLLSNKNSITILIGYIIIIQINLQKINILIIWVSTYYEFGVCKVKVVTFWAFSFRLPSLLSLNFKTIYTFPEMFENPKLTSSHRNLDLIFIFILICKCIFVCVSFCFSSFF